MKTMKLTSLPLLVLMTSFACGEATRTNASATAPRAQPGPVVSVAEFGARGDGLTPDTDAIQAAVDALAPGGTLRFPAGTYLIETNKAVRLKDDVHLDLGSATLVGPNVSGVQNRMLEVQGARNVVISGGTLVGSRSGSPGLGLGLFASDAQDLLVEDVHLRDFFLDGILLTGNQGCRRVTVRRCVSENNRRTGMAIVHASDVTVEDSRFEGSHGQSPQAGVNCEPNGGEAVQGVHFSRCTFSRNAGVGLYVHRGLGTTVSDVSVQDSVVESNDYGIVASGVDGLRLEASRIAHHGTRGRSGIVLGENTSRAAVVGNTLEDVFRGILTVAATGVELRENTITGLGATSEGDEGHGIDCRGAGDSSQTFVVAGNVIRGVSGSGIVAQRLSGAHFQDNVVQDTGRRGLQLLITSDSEVRGNSVSGIGQERPPGRYDGIELQQASNRNTIVSNTLRRSAGMREPIGIARDCIGNQVLSNVVLPE
jgi:nitrous oxidase accessory protein NosD